MGGPSSACPGLCALRTRSWIQIPYGDSWPAFTNGDEVSIGETQERTTGVALPIWCAMCEVVVGLIAAAHAANIRARVKSTPGNQRAGLGRVGLGVLLRQVFLAVGFNNG